VFFCLGKKKSSFSITFFENGEGWFRFFPEISEWCLIFTKLSALWADDMRKYVDDMPGDLWASYYTWILAKNRGGQNDKKISEGVYAKRNKLALNRSISSKIFPRFLYFTCKDVMGVYVVYSSVYLVYYTGLRERSWPPDRGHDPQREVMTPRERSWPPERGHDPQREVMTPQIDPHLPQREIMTPTCLRERSRPLSQREVTTPASERGHDPCLRERSRPLPQREVTIPASERGHDPCLRERSRPLPQSIVRLV